jgi:hypothetical protein
VRLSNLEAIDECGGAITWVGAENPDSVPHGSHLNTLLKILEKLSLGPIPDRCFPYEACAN